MKYHNTHHAINFDTPNFTINDAMNGTLYCLKLWQPYLAHPLLYLAIKVLKKEESCQAGRINLETWCTYT